MNAGNKAEVEKAAKAEQAARECELADIRWVMSDKRGRRFINRIIKEADVFGPIFNPNGSITNLNLGKRLVGLFVYSELEQSCPEMSLLMRQEYVKESNDHA